MAEYTNPGILTVAAGQNVPLTSAALVPVSARG